MNYGLPYKGSKNKLAERIVSLLPKRTHLIDLFCGGCAIAHAALVKNKYQHIHINDINWMCPTLFIDALNGKYANDTRWISREDFHRLKDTDPYVAVVWSFGNNMKDYLYGQDIEPLKKAVHYAIFFSDYSLAADLGHDLSFIDSIPDITQRYAAVRRYLNQFGHFQQPSVGRGGRIRNMSKDRQNCNIWSQPAECRKFKKKEFHSENSAMQSDTAECRKFKKTKKFTRRTIQCRAIRQNADCNTGNINNAAPLSFGGGVQITHYPQCA